MTIARTKSPGWGVNEKLTSGQQNALDINVTNALDKRAGQTDTLSSAVTVASGGSISLASGSSFATVAGCPSVLGGTFRANGTAQFFGIATFNAAATFNADLSTNGNLFVLGDADISGTLTSSFSLVSTGDAAFTGNNTFSVGSSAFTGATTAADFTMTSTNRVKLASRSITRTITESFLPATSNWVYNDSVGSPSTTNTSSAYGWFNINVPEGAVIQTINVWIQPAKGHLAAPAGMPHIQLLRKFPSAGGSGMTLTAAANDVWAGATSYELPHAITLSGIGYTVTRMSARICVLVATEVGAGTILGTIIHGCDVTYTTTSMDDGPCN